MNMGWGFRTPGQHVTVVLALILILVAVAPTARAASGDGQDPREGTSKLDIKRFFHSDADGFVTYGLETHDAYAVKTDFWTAQWDFDFNGDGTVGDACIRVEQSTDSTLRAVLHTDCGPESFSTAEVQKDGNTIQFRFPIKDLVDVGLVSDQSYAYRVTTKDLDGHEDTAPDGKGLVTQDGVSLDPKDVSRIEEQRHEELVQSQGGPEAAAAAAHADSADARSSTPSEAGEEGAAGNSAAQPVSSSGSGLPVGLIVVLAIVAGVVVAGSLVTERRRRRRAATSGGDRGVVAVAAHTEAPADVIHHHEPSGTRRDQSHAFPSESREGRPPQQGGWH